MTMKTRELLDEVLKGKVLAEPLEQIPEDALFGVWTPAAMSNSSVMRHEFNSFWDAFIKDARYGKPRLVGEQPHYNPQTGAAEFRFARLLVGHADSPCIVRGEE